MSETIVLKVEGMTCGHCKMTVENALRSVAGVSSAAVDLAKKTATVSYEAGKASLEALKEAIDEAGYEVVGVGA